MPSRLPLRRMSISTRSGEVSSARAIASSPEATTPATISPMPSSMFRNASADQALVFGNENACSSHNPLCPPERVLDGKGKPGFRAGIGSADLELPFQLSRQSPHYSQPQRLHILHIEAR